LNFVRNFFVSACCVIVAPMAMADLPLTIEDLITDRNKVKLDLSFSYANSDRQGISTAEPITVQIGPTSFVTLPTVIGESQGNNDSLVGALGMRYGLTGKAEIYARGSYLYNNRRNRNVSGISSNSDHRFVDAWAGVNYQFKKDDNSPAVLSFFELALREKHRESSRSFKSALLGVTIYTTMDPVVLSLTVAYRVNQSRKDGVADYRPGNLLLLNPSIAFAVNDRITLTTGLQWTNQQADRIDDTVQNFRHTSTDLLLGVGYGLLKGSTLNLTFKANASGSNGADLRLNWLHTF